MTFRTIVQGVIALALVGACVYCWVTLGEAPDPLVGTMGVVLGWIFKAIAVTKGGGS